MQQPVPDNGINQEGDPGRQHGDRQSRHGILPSFLIIVMAEKKLLKNRFVQAALSGIKPCIIGIIGAIGSYMILHRQTGIEKERLFRRSV